MNTTMSLYEQIQRNINKNQGYLTPLLKQLHDQVSMSKESLKTKGKNNSQILAQIYQHLQRPIAKLKRQINCMIPQSQLQRPKITSQQIMNQQIGQKQQQQQYQQSDKYDNNQNKYDEQQLDMNQQDLQQDEQQQQEQQQQEEELQEEQDMNEQNQQFDEQLIDGQEDVGLYGQQLDDEEEIQSYENEISDRQFKQFENKNEGEENDEDDNIIEDNFDQFRQVELKNDKQQITRLQSQIDNLQEKALNKKDWMIQGQIKGKQRPVNSLLSYDLQFNSGLKYQQQISQQHNCQLQKIIKQRILDQLFDDRSRYVNGSALRQHFGSLKDVSTQKSDKGLAQLYELQFKNYLGLGQNKNDRLKKQIMQSFKQINYYLDSLCNLNFTPKPVKSGKQLYKNEQAIISQQKVPITLWVGGQKSEKKNLQLKSNKQVDKKSKRLKNKRISKQRKKQQDKKRLHKKIQYGGISKYEAQVRKKIIKNKQDKSGTKYSKSSSFFKHMNQKGSIKAGKPNPNINKIKI